MRIRTWFAFGVLLFVAVFECFAEEKKSQDVSRYVAVRGGFFLDQDKTDSQLGIEFGSRDVVAGHFHLSFNFGADSVVGQSFVRFNQEKLFFGAKVGYAVNNIATVDSLLFYTPIDVLLALTTHDCAKSAYCSAQYENGGLGFGIRTGGGVAYEYRSKFGFFVEYNLDILFVPVYFQQSALLFGVMIYV